MFSNEFEKYGILSRKILELSDSGIQLIDFLDEISKLFIEYINCESVEMWIRENGHILHTQLFSKPNKSLFHYEHIPETNGDGKRIESERSGEFYEFFNKLNQHLPLYSGKIASFITKTPTADIPMLNELPIIHNNAIMGIIQFHGWKPEILLNDNPLYIMDLSRYLGLALINQRTNEALKEREKELNCLYGIINLSCRLELPIEETLKEIISLLPLAMHYPDEAACRIIIGESSFVSDNFQFGRPGISSDIYAKGDLRGYIEVIYTKIKPDLDDGPFSKEKKSFLDLIAKHISSIIERKESDISAEGLRGQLRHCHRLATIGQLAAGIAHELNEPLSSILGFAQLAKKSSDIGQIAERDVDRIIKASLYSRELIKKLLLFSRETHSKKIPLNINKVIEDGLFFFESRCAKRGVELIRNLDESLPQINGDKSQLIQALINLVVNAIQAMPHGGKLIIQTTIDGAYVSLVIEDTGTGMPEEIKNKIFNPFFTTKDESGGTGLGLSVVQGIVSAHRGKISVDSVFGKGSRFIIKLPVEEI